MAWGNFSAIPCPYHKWHDDSRKAMLSMLPIVGIMISCITVAAWWILDMLGVPDILTGVLVTAVYFCTAGFIHLDGFMDCSDAILSRRPELEERQRILKSSDVGAFAVISLMLMLMVFTASMIILAQEFDMQRAGMLAGVMVISRCMAADNVMRKPAMKTSQYIDLGDSDAVADRNSGKYEETKQSNNKQKKKFTGEDFALSLIAVLTVVILPAICASGTRNRLLEDIVLFIPVVAVLIAAAIAGRNARNQLGGMNGDIAGYMIVMSETAGVLAAALTVSVFGI